MIKTVLFDLDGTLLPIDEKKFLEYYFGLLSQRLAKFNFEPNKLIESVWHGTKAMVLNDGSKTNEQAFWDDFKSIYGDNVMDYSNEFEDFYKNEFDKAQASTKLNPLAKKSYELLKEKGYNIILATNPIFPKIATLKRIKWAGFLENDFSYLTSYENSCYAKPNPKYYLEILNKFNIDPKECLMVGNDVEEDMIPAESLGMKTFLLTDCLLNRKNKNINVYNHGSFSDLINYINKNL